MGLAHLREEVIEDPGGHGPQGLCESGNTRKMRGPEKLNVGECRGTRDHRSHVLGRAHHAVVNAQNTAGSAKLPEPPDGRRGPVHLAGCPLTQGVANPDGKHPKNLDDVGSIHVSRGPVRA